MRRYFFWFYLKLDSFFAVGTVTMWSFWRGPVVGDLVLKWAAQVIWRAAGPAEQNVAVPIPAPPPLSYSGYLWSGPYHLRVSALSTRESNGGGIVQSVGSGSSMKKPASLRMKSGNSSGPVAKHNHHHFHPRRIPLLTYIFLFHFGNQRPPVTLPFGVLFFHCWPGSFFFFFTNSSIIFLKTSLLW